MSQSNFCLLYRHYLKSGRYGIAAMPAAVGMFQRGPLLDYVCEDAPFKCQISTKYLSCELICQYKRY